MSPIDEFRRRAEVREVNYAQAADEIYEMPEGVFENHHRALAIEKSILTHSFKGMGGVVTVLPNVFLRAPRWESFKSRFVSCDLDMIELRDDFLTPDQIRQIVTELPQLSFLFSFRKDLESSKYWLVGEGRDILDKAAWIDWALELGEPTEILTQIPKEKIILSSHEKETLETLRTYESQVAHCKWAPEVETFEELLQGHRWQKSSPNKRSYLPRSVDGRWYWYRCLQKGQQLLNFWRYDDGSALDQPSLFQWISSSPNGAAGKSEFAAILGDPVYHSFTPLEQSDFFAKRGLAVFAVRIPRDEFSVALPILREMGMRYAAVTSPHKHSAAELCASELRAVNTLYWSPSRKKWLGTSTDNQGFVELIEGVGMIAPLQKEIFVWGGGGTLEMVEQSIPHASFFASRTGEPREGSHMSADLQPKIMIWAAPRGPETLWPPLTWRPAMVFDLNYKEDSMGREYALRCGAHYQSGLTMFQGQAQGQRSFWTKCEDSE
jgi:shikimate 5-dehydrogenase